ncbi:MAG: hypothetical protein ACK4NC_01410 [Candidatus Gracilibacteria bacterium]
MLSDQRLTFIEIDDEITDVFSKISSQKDKTVYLVIPGRSMLLTSIVNLKLIRKKAEEEKKTVIIVTQDKIGRTLASQAGLTALKDYKEIEEFTQEPQEPSIKHYQQKKDEKNNQEKVKKVPEGVGEKLAYLFGFYKYDKETAKYRMVFTKPSKKAYMTILFFSVLILFTIAFFGLPDAKITIIPKLNATSVETNVTLTGAPTSLADKQVHMQQIEVIYEKTFKQPATGGVFKGENAKGKIKIFNRSTKPWPLVTNSRIQTNEGLVYLTKKFVSVPEAKGDTPGTLEVEVEARERDANNQFMGERGNIGPMKFTFPGLSSTNQKLIYAESTSPMTGGVTNVERFVVKEDVEEANKNIIQELKNMAPEYLQSELKKVHGEDETYKIFQIHDDRFVQSELVSVGVPKDILNQRIDSFEVQGKMRAKAYYVNQDDLKKIMQDYFVNHKLTAREKLLSMDPQSLQFVNIFPSQNSDIKITARMNGLVTFSFDRDNETLIKTIQSNVTGIKREDAEKFIQNLPEVEKVNVSLSPAWQKTLPTIKENIDIEILDPKV